MTQALWRPLRRELAAFRESGLRLPLWWRDDDATRPTPALDRLARLADQTGLPVHLAIVPAHAQPDLEPYLTGGSFRAVVHGWAHENHAPPGQKSAEFGTPRTDALDKAEKGLHRLRWFFGTAVHPMFVPPWNRIHDDMLAGLSSAGYRYLSTFGPRATAQVAPGLTAINAHVDPVDWHGTRGLADPGIALDRLVAHLRARRRGEADATEPLGLLTHHLMMDDPTWDFSGGLLNELREGPVDLLDIAIARDSA